MPERTRGSGQGQVMANPVEAAERVGRLCEEDGADGLLEVLLKT